MCSTSQHNVLTQIRHPDADTLEGTLVRPDAKTKLRTGRTKQLLKCCSSQQPCPRGVYCQRKGMAVGKEDVVTHDMWPRRVQLFWHAGQILMLPHFPPNQALSLAVSGGTLAANTTTYCSTGSGRPLNRIIALLISSH
jgi:hypothetical protein